MNRRTLRYVLAGAVGAVAAGGIVEGRPSSAEETTVAALARETHFHGIAVDAGDPKRLFLATHHGLYAVGEDGKARRISEWRDDFMGFTPHPTEPAVLYASGHPAGGGNLGFVVSTDGGRSWRKLADGLGGPVDFHQMDVSKADPRVVYGVHGALQRSADGGRTWTRIGPPPEGIIAVAASSRNADALYAATEKGLLRSLDGGRAWQPAHVAMRPATAVHVTHEGQVYAFIVGAGLVRAAEPGLNWQTVSRDFADNYVLHLAAAPGDGQRVYAVVLDPRTHAESVHASRDGGANWTRLGSE